MHFLFFFSCIDHRHMIKNKLSDSRIDYSFQKEAWRLNVICLNLLGSCFNCL